MMKLTVAALTAIASVSAIQTQADASAEWHHGGYYNPWAQQSQGGWYGGSSYSSPYGYGDSKVQRLQRDVSYLVKMNNALKTRLVAAEAALTELEENVPTVDTSDFEARIAAL